METNFTVEQKYALSLYFFRLLEDATDDTSGSQGAVILKAIETFESRFFKIEWF